MYKMQAMILCESVIAEAVEVAGPCVDLNHDAFVSANDDDCIRERLLNISVLMCSKEEERCQNSKNRLA